MVGRFTNKEQENKVTLFSYGQRMVFLFDVIFVFVSDLDRTVDDCTLLNCTSCHAECGWPNDDQAASREADSDLQEGSSCAASC